ncbi:putative transcriptional regulator, AraC family [Gordonia polyisoprenivorans VH2]|uniref:Putative transcriptional regulator, AraC family n=1 Tax=Gordonia polyisoprenivorans (strain DSM 44266 / VH2) TaxID=1112204 RepID=H6MTV5_GORPV|nr:helix-turn-helix domain-containing protein [Gordonia polyisoprenivorans]AFA75186.1 putative transcriptional regulator, AraC family [Gordonia polyisoprenivorans VH2]
MRVAIHVFDGVSLFHVAAPQMVFREAAVLAPDPALWSITLWAAHSGDVELEMGQRLSGISGPEATTAADIVIVPSWPESAPEIDDVVRSALLDAHGRGAIIAGLCLGAIAVADTGLLEGRGAVTHWLGTRELERRGRCGWVDDSVLYIDHGDVITSAGTVSSVDACLHLLRRLCGADLANRVARRMVVAPHRDGGQAQYIEHPLATRESDTSVSAVLEWVIGHLDSDLSVSGLAARARMSRRSFLRHFRDATGTTPARWVTTQRVAHARTLLETTDLDIGLIAHRCGFGSEVTLRQNFVARFGVSPSVHRNQFRPG